ncbi:MAG: TolC family protein [Rhodocyclaceae bacterium]|nr:TolC family protein [Rhodocyclaceae bacterium]
MVAALALTLTGPLTASPAHAEPTTELPPEQVVQTILESRPAVQRAASQLRAEEAVARGLMAGPQEWTVRGDIGQRRETGPTTRQFEWRAGIDRPIRFGDKAAADTRIGERGVETARWMLGDARHEASRALLAAWFAWLRAEAVLATRESADLALQRIADTVRKREALGDAARLERIQAESALAQSQSATLQARRERDAARTLLVQQYPALGLRMPDLPEPTPLDMGTDWAALILEHSHELGVAQAEAERASAVAERSRLERRPDPTVGMGLAQERGGDERIVVLTLSMPIPGESRREQGVANLARADAARAQVDETRLRIVAEARALVERVGTSVQAWQSAEAAARQTAEVAELTALAQRLGERAISDVLLAQRLASEARQQAVVARLDALEARDRVWLDAHTIWKDND